MKKNSGSNGGSTFNAEDTSALDAEIIADEDELASSGTGTMGNMENGTESGLGAVTSQVKDTAKQALDQGQQVAGQALDKAKDTVKSQLTSQKEKAVSTLGSFTEALHQTGDQLRQSGQGVFGGYADSLAGQIDRAVDYLRENDIDDLTGQVEDFARKQPALFIGGAFVLGIAIARFLKSSQSGTVGYNGSGNYGALAPVPTPASAGALTTVNEGTGTGTSGRTDQFSDEALPDSAPISAHGYVSGVGVTGNSYGDNSGSSSGSSESVSNTFRE